MEEKKSLMEEWEDDELTAEQEDQKAKKGLFKKRAPKEKKAKKEKTPLTPEQKKKRRKRIIIGGVVVVVLAVTILPRAFSGPSYPVVSVREVTLGSVTQAVDGSGTVESQEVKTYFSPVSATVSDFDLQVGDTVEAGDTLLTYDGAELDDLYRQAELTGSAANYGYRDSIEKDNKNASEYKRSSEALDIINRQLDEEDDNVDHLNKRVNEYTGYQGDSSNKLADLRSQQDASKAAIAALDAANQELKDAQFALDNSTLDKTGEDYKKLQDAVTVARNAVTQATKPAADAQASLPNIEKSIQEEQEHYNDIVKKLDSYQERLKDAQENKSKLETSKSKEEGIKDSSDAAKLSGSAKSQLAAQNNLSTLEAQMTKDDIQQGKDGIKADFSGVVTKVAAVAGGPAAKGGELFTVASSEDVVVEMSITKYDLEKMEEGQKATVTLAGHTYEGTVQKLSRIAEKNEKGTPVVSAQVKIDNPDENIYLGLEVKVNVQGRSVKDVLVVPAECVNSGQDGDFCYVVNADGVVEKKMIEKGLSSDDSVEVKSGLAAGDKVISGGLTTGIEEGIHVTAVEE